MFNIDVDHIAVAQKPRRLHRVTNTLGRTRRNNVTGFQRHTKGQIPNDSRDGENHLAGSARLALLAIDTETDGEILRVVNRARMDYPRPHCTRAIETLALEPLVVVALQIARGQVVDYRVAENRIECRRFRNVASACADHNPEFGLIVEFRGRIRIKPGRLLRPENGRGCFREELRCRGVSHITAARPITFFDMRPVVAANAEHVLARTRNRREQLNIPDCMAYSFVRAAKCHTRRGKRVVTVRDKFDQIRGTTVKHRRKVDDHSVVVDDTESLAPLPNGKTDKPHRLGPGWKSVKITAGRTKLTRAANIHFGRIPGYANVAPLAHGVR